MFEALNLEVEIVSTTVAEKLAARFADGTIRKMLGPALVPSPERVGDRLVYALDLKDGVHLRRDVALLDSALGVGWEGGLVWVEGPTSVVSGAALALGARECQVGTKSARAGWDLSVGGQAIEVPIPRLGTLVVRRRAVP